MVRRSGSFLGHDGLDAPDAPSIDSVTAGNAQVSVAFTAGTAGTTATTGFVAQVSTDGTDYSVSSNTGSSSPIVVSSLTNGTAATAKVWAINAHGTSVPSAASSSFTPVTPRGLFAGGRTTGAADSAVNTIDFILPSSAGNATDFGDLSVARQELGVGSAGSGTRGLFFGGENVSGNKTNIVDYVTLGSTGNASDFGNLTGNRNQSGTCSSDTRALSGGGSDQLAIDYFTIASTGNATDFGDLVNPGNGKSTGLSGLASPTRGIFGSVADGGGDQINYVTIASAGNAQDFGNLTASAQKHGSGSNNTRGIFTGGGANTIQYITIGSTGNASDFGDLSISAEGNTAVTDATKMCIALSSDGSSAVNTIDQITIASAGNATDFGDTSVTRQGLAGASSVHGGLS